MAQPRKHLCNARRQAAYRHRTHEAQEALLSTRGLPPLPAVPTIPGKARWKAARKQARLLIQMVMDEMTEYYDQRSETWKETEPAERLQEQVDGMNELIEKLEEWEQE